MEWQDDEFEQFLRQFQPRRPSPLPARRMTKILVMAAAILLAAVIPLRTMWNTPAESEPSAATLNVKPSTTGAPAAVLSRGAGNSTRGATSQRLKVSELIRPPIRVVNVNPVYPEDAKAAGIQGIVLLEIVIGTEGTVIETTVTQSIPELDQAAIDAVRQWQYQPTLLNGQPVEVELTATINFTLQ